MAQNRTTLTLPGKGTTDAIFVVRQFHEKYREKGKEVYYDFMDLEKAFHRVPGEVFMVIVKFLVLGLVSISIQV